jgi:DNA-binding CsgD family transcriptional regulator
VGGLVSALPERLDETVSVRFDLGALPGDFAPYRVGMLRLLHASSDSGVIDFERTLSPRGWRASPIYNEICRPQGLDHMLLLTIQLRGQPLGWLWLSRAGRRGFSARDAEAARVLLPALALAEASFEPRPAAAPQPRVVAVPIADDEGRAARARLARLSARQAQVAELVARGLGNREIALLLGTSPLTVRNQLSRIYRELEADGRTEHAVLFARANAG